MTEGTLSTIETPRASVSPAPLDVAMPGARHALLLLVLINLFNYIDRQVLAAVEPQVRHAFFAVTDPETGKITEKDNAKELTGYLAFAFLATYMLTAPLFGSLATRMPRWWLIGIGVGVWSLASGASGLAPYLGMRLGIGTTILIYGMSGAYLIMLITRCLVGLGEAVYGPVAPDIISDLYPVKMRGQVLAWFYAAIPFGGALGYSLGSIVVDTLQWDWRFAFYLVVPPGIALAIWCLFLPEPPRGKTDAAQTTQRQAKWSDYWFMLRIPSYALNTAGMTMMCFAMGGLAFWAPGYLLHRQVPRIFYLEPKMFFGILTALLGLIATILGGIVGDALRKRFPGSYFLVSGAAMCLGFPMLLLMTLLPYPLAWIPMGLFIFCLFFNTGPTNCISANVVHPLLRARGFALNILIIHLLGDAASPSIMGKIIGKDDNFDLAFQFVAVTVLLGGLLWIWGAWYLERDTLRAPHHLPESPAP